MRQWVKIDIDIITYLCVESNFVENLKTQILKFEGKKKKITLIINYCRFVEIESEACKVCRDTD